RVKRELVRRDVSKNLIGQNRRSEFVYTITLKNLLAAPAQVMVMDQIPLSRHESIKAKLLDASPPVTEQTDLNVLKWELELAPGAERQVSFAFMVEHPRSLQIVGLRD
ncbi:MAG: DUF4139 domain-containing protein, partial [Anaerolineae bacterium]